MGMNGQRMFLFTGLLVFCCGLGAMAAGPESTDSINSNAAKSRAERLAEIKAILERNLAVRTAMAKGPGLKNGADFIGSGAVKVSAWGTPDACRFMVERDDCYYDMGQPVKDERGTTHGSYWRLGPLMAGELQFDLPALKEATCRQEQDLYRAEVRLMATQGAHALAMTSKVLRTSPNLIQTVMHNTGSAPLDVKLNSFATPSDEPKSLRIDRFAGLHGQTIWNSRRNHAGCHKYRMWIGMATRLLGTEGTFTTNNTDTSTLSFTIPAGQAVTLVTAVTSTGVPLTNDPADPIPAALEQAAQIAPASLLSLEKAHQASWDDYWLRSCIAIPAQPEMERYYYGALYGLGSAHRADNSGWAPGLVGWSTYDAQCTGWGAGHTLDYNLEAIYYGIYSSNRADLDEAYFRLIKPLADGFGVKAAKKLGYPGIVMPGGVAICGVVNHDGLGMKTNSAECALPLIDHWFYTYDTEFLKKVYPYLRQTADFWDAFLIKEPSGRYVIKGTSIWEGRPQNYNCASALAFVKRFYTGLLDASAVLGVDGDRRGKWQEILANLADFPTRTHGGKPIACYAEDQGEKIDPTLGASMTLPLYPVFPAQLIGLGSDPAKLKLYRDTLRECGRVWWSQPNSFVHTPVQAVRLGYDFAEIQAKFKKWLSAMTPNNFKIQAGGYFECVGAIEAVNSMLMQSQEGVIRLFPNWDGSDAHFHQLRAVGAFLVSAALKSGTVAELAIASEKGRPCRLVNPWPGKPVSVRAADGQAAAVVEQNGVLEFSTVQGGCYILSPVEKTEK